MTSDSQKMSGGKVAIYFTAAVTVSSSVPTSHDTQNENPPTLQSVGSRQLGAVMM